MVPDRIEDRSEFYLRKMLQMTEVRNRDGKKKEMKVWQFYVVVC